MWSNVRAKSKWKSERRKTVEGRGLSSGMISKGRGEVQSHRKSKMRNKASNGEKLLLGKKVAEEEEERSCE